MVEAEDGSGSFEDRVGSSFLQHICWACPVPETKATSACSLHVCHTHASQ